MKKLAFRLACLFAACTCLCALPACTPKAPQIAFFVYDGTDTYISELMGKITESIPPGYTVEIYDAGNSQAVQNQQILEAIERRFNMLVVNAVDRLACSSIVEKCAGENLPVIFFNREPLEDAMIGGNVYYVGAAADSLGEKQADMVAALFGPDFADSPYDKNADGVVQLVILKGEQGHQDAEKRTANCVSRLKALGFAVEVLAIEPANWARREGQDAMEGLYARFGDMIELVFANNDDMALGAIDYMLEIGAFHESETGPYEQPFVIVGVDGTAVGREAIAKGLLYGTVLNDSSRQADAITTLADYLLTQRDLADYPYAVTRGHYIFIDGDIILRENLANYTN